MSACLLEERQVRNRLKAGGPQVATQFSDIRLRSRDEVLISWNEHVRRPRKRVDEVGGNCEFDPLGRLTSTQIELPQSKLVA